jgi:hypothetical protein
VSPKELLIRQLQAENPYEIPDLIQEYVTCHHKLSKATLYHRIGAVLEFLRKNRCQLPPDVTWSSFKVESDVPRVQGRLTAEAIRNVIARLPVRWRSLFPVKYQALLDTSRLYWVNLNSAEQIVNQLNEGREIIRVDLPCGRKSKAGDRLGMYFTYFGRDAASDLARYFHDERGWPERGEPIWVYTRQDYENNGWTHCKQRKVGDPIGVITITEKWIRLLRSTNYTPKKRDSIRGPAARYGYNLHEFRDVAVTELHTHAKSKGLDMDCVKIWCGLLSRQLPPSHRFLIDELYKNREYMERQYAIAEPYLNIISGTPTEHRQQSPTHGSWWSYGITYSVSLNPATQLENSHPRMYSEAHETCDKKASL